MKEKYGDMDAEEREVMMKLHGTKPMTGFDMDLHL